MAVTANQLITRSEGDRVGGPVAASTHLYEATMAFFSATGYIVGIVAAGANPFAGIVLREVDNSAGADGDLTAELLADDVFILPGTGFTQATVGLDIYASDNYTVTTSNSSTSYVGQCVGYVSSTLIKVRVKKTGPSSVLSGSATGTTAATFTADTDVGKPRTAIGSQTGGTGDFTGVIVPPATLTADRIYTLPADSAQTLVGATATQTLTNKTLTSPVVNTPAVTDLTEVVTATNVIAASETGSTFFLNSATEFVSTLPAPAAGLKFRFIVSAAPSGASYTIVTNSSSNIIKGNIVTAEDAAADFETSGGDTISFVDGQAVAGDMVELFCDGTNWFAYGQSKVAAGITITTAS